MRKVLGQFAGLLAVAATLVAAPGGAQSIDPRVLQQVQGQLSGSNAGDAVDRSRAQGEQQQEGFSTDRAVRIDTREEQELRRAEARTSLSRLYRPSPIEREYRDRLADPTLRQFGYDLFQSASGSTGGLTGAVGDDFVVGIGDDVIVQFQGATNDSKTVRISRDGRLVVGALPPMATVSPMTGTMTRSPSRSRTDGGLPMPSRP